MTATLAVHCKTCGAEERVEVPVDVPSVDVGTGIEVDVPCRACGGELFAPGGHYERDPEGLLIRTGSFRGCD